MQHTILWIEGRRAKTPPFVSLLKEKGYQVAEFRTGKAALEQAAAHDPDLTVLNAASMGTSGARTVSALRETLKARPLVVILNEDKRQSDLPADEILILPFTIRKLENRLRRLLPVEGERILKAGQVALDLDGHTAQIGPGIPIRLTSMAADVLKELMSHPGEVVSRERLFRRVWQTDYLGDTRTLDVHISWLRKALEKDPKKPHLIRTIRGVGYRLEV